MFDSSEMLPIISMLILASISNNFEEGVGEMKALHSMINDLCVGNPFNNIYQ